MMSTDTSSQGFAIAIDGPTASGKGTISKELAKRVKGFNFDTGAMYRAFALLCIRKNIEIEDISVVLDNLSHADIIFSDNDKVLLNGEDVSEVIRDKEVSSFTPKIAAIKEVREEMVKRQQAFINERTQKGQIVVVDARDAATVIVPDAKYKFYIWAQEMVRAQRRWEQLGKETSGKTVDEVLEELKARDTRDIQRSASPLVKKDEAVSEGYVFIDTSATSVDEDVEQILEKIQK